MIEREDKNEYITDQFPNDTAEEIQRIGQRERFKRVPLIQISLQSHCFMFTKFLPNSLQKLTDD